VSYPPLRPRLPALRSFTPFPPSAGSGTYRAPSLAEFINLRAMFMQIDAVLCLGNMLRLLFLHVLFIKLFYHPLKGRFLVIKGEKRLIILKFKKLGR
jgi:hypothetical protein